MALDRCVVCAASYDSHGRAPGDYDAIHDLACHLR